jgi:hypothetical protein
MHDSATIESALNSILRKTFRSPADPNGGPVEAEFDAGVVRQDEAKLVLEVDVYLSCSDDDQEYASIMAREEWWSQISSALYKELGLLIEAEPFRLNW